MATTVSTKCPITTHKVPLRSNRTITIQTSLAIVQFPVRMPSLYEHEQLKSGSGSLYYPRGVEEHPRLNMSGVALAWKDSFKPNSKQPGAIKISVMTALNGITPRDRTIAKMPMKTLYDAELHRLTMQRELTFAGGNLHEISGAALAGTNSTGSLTQGPCVISGSFTFQGSNAMGTPFVPGDRVRWVLPYLPAKKEGDKFGFPKDPPRVFDCAPGLVFADFEKVEHGSVAEGNAAVAYPLHLIRAAENAEMNDLLAHSIEVKALTRILFKSEQGILYERLLQQCLEVIQYGEKAYHLYNGRAYDAVQVKVDRQMRGAPSKYCVQLTATDAARAHFSEGRTQVEVKEYQPVLDEGAIDAELEHRFIMHTVDNLDAHYRCNFDNREYQAGDVIVAATNAPGTVINIFDVGVVKVDLTTFKDKLATWCKVPCARPVLQHAEAARLAMAILKKLADYNAKRGGANVPPIVLYTVTQTRGVPMKAPIDYCTPEAFHHWLSGHVANMDELKAELRSREVGNVVNDNAQGSIVINVCTA
jgi:hypothetical protein